MYTNKKWEGVFYVTKLKGLDTFNDMKLLACTHDEKGKLILNVRNIDREFQSLFNRGTAKRDAQF